MNNPVLYIIYVLVMFFIAALIVDAVENYRTKYLVPLMVLFVLVFAMMVGVAKAQDVSTNFVPTCMTSVDENTVNINIDYESTGGDEYTIEVLALLDTTIPAHLEPEVGRHHLGYVQLHSEDTSQSYIVRFSQVATGLQADMTINTWDIGYCDSPDYIAPPDVFLPTMTPEPQPIPAPVYSTGVTCTMKYPQLVLVCNKGA